MDVTIDKKHLPILILSIFYFIGCSPDQKEKYIAMDLAGMIKNGHIESITKFHGILESGEIIKGDKISEDHFNDFGKKTLELGFYEEENTRKTYVYDENDNLIKSKSYENGTLSNEERYFYDENANLLKKETYNKDGYTTRKTSLEYNSDGKIDLEKTYHGNGELRSKINYIYDKNGYIRTKVVSRNRFPNNRYTTFVRDSIGQILIERKFYGNKIDQEIEYIGNGRIFRSFSDLGEVEEITKLTISPNKLLSIKESPDGTIKRKHTVHKNKHGDAIRVTNENISLDDWGYTYNYKYDEFGNWIIKTTTSDGEGTSDIVIREISYNWEWF